MTLDLLLDIGNTRSKWVAVPSSIDQGFTVLHEGQCLNRDLSANNGGHLEEIFSSPEYSTIETIFCSCVGGEKMLNIWQKSFSKARFLQLRSDFVIPGFKNTYINPAELGTDRFAGMLGAHDLDLHSSALVISCGTATTIDFLEKGSVFQGGWILPGLDLMLQSLGKSTAQLPNINTAALDSTKLSAANLASLSPVKHKKLSTIVLGNNTEQAISMGVLLSIVGAIEYAIKQLQNPSYILLTGGNASLIYHYLLQEGRNIRIIMEPNLIYRGLNVWRKQWKGTNT